VKILATLLFVFILSFGFRTLHGQPGTFHPTNIPVVHGDTDLVGTYDTSWSNSISYVSGHQIVENDGVFSWGDAVAYWTADTIGRVNSHIIVLVSRYEGPPAYLQYAITGTAVGISDSMVRIRPRRWTAVLYPDSVNGGWKGFTEPKLFNNIATSTTFDSWKLSVDTTLGCQMHLSKDSASITSCTAKPFDTNLIRLNFSTSSGPTLADSTFPATIRIHVHNKDQDSTYTQQIILLLKKAPRNMHATLSPSSMRFIGTGGQTQTQTATLFHEASTSNFKLDPLTYPFHASAVRLTDSTDQIIVQCSPSSSGSYQSTLHIHYLKPDFLQRIVNDTLEIALSAEIDNLHDSQFWVRTSLVDVNDSVGPCAIDTDGVLYASSKNFWNTSDEGVTWVQLPSPAPNISEVVAGTRGWIDVRSGFDLYGSQDKGKNWSLQSLRSQNVGGYFFGRTLFKPGMEPVAIGFFMARIGNETHSETDAFSRNLVDTGWVKIADLPGGTTKFLSRNGVTHYVGGRRITSTIDTAFFPSFITPFVLARNGSLYAGTTNDGIFIRENDSVKWHQSSLTIGDITAIACSNDGSVYATTSTNGVYRTTDNGVSWHGVNGGLGTTHINSIALRDGHVAYLGTSAGVYRSLKPIGTGLSRAAAPNVIEGVLVNFPNPASERTSIRYLLKSGRDLRMHVYDCIGREVRRIDLGERMAGPQTIEMDVSTLATGAYHYRFDRDIESGVMIVAR